jgi:hypothetical protein
MHAQSRIPSHEIRKGLDLVRLFHDADTSYRSSHVCQFAMHGEDPIGLSDGKDRRYEECKTKRDTSFRATLRSARSGKLSLVKLLEKDEQDGKATSNSVRLFSAGW